MVDVLIADKQTSVRYAWSVLLSRQEGMVIVGEVANMEDCVEAANVLQPDVLLLDWELPGFVGQPSLEKLRMTNPRLKIIAMSGLPGVRFTAVAAGVNAFIHKSEPPDPLLLVLNRYQAVA